MQKSKKLLIDLKNQKRKLTDSWKCGGIVAFKYCPIGMSITGLDGRFLRVNRNLCKMLGYAEKELLKKNFQDVTHPDDRKIGDRARDDLKRGIISHAQFDKRYIAKSGKIIWITLAASIIRDKSGKPLYFVSQMMDISRRKEAEEKLKESENLYKKVVQMSPDAVTITDLKGKIIVASKQTAKLHGFKSIDEILGRDSFEFIIPKDRKKASINLKKTLKEEIIRDVEYTMLRKDGSTFVANLNAALVRDRHGDPQLFVGIVRDVTKAKEVDLAKTEFVSLASHQLRSPLSAINWYTEMLLNGDAGKLNPKQKEFLDEVYSSNKKMTQLVSDLLNVSRIELGSFIIEPEPTDFIKVAENVIHEFQPFIRRKKLKLATEYDNRLRHISADPKLLRIVFENLISNAIKYTSVAGKLSLIISRDGKNRGILIKISDFGWGIPRSQQNKIFTKLFRADNVKVKDSDGTGLGLYIVKSIVDNSGGKIWFESKENKGTTFYVSWPMSGMKAKKGTKELS